jgi:hypothetical protein
MKKILIVILLITIAVIAFYKSNNKTPIQKELNNFAIEDTSSITKVFFADRFDNTVTLKKLNGQWLVDDKYTVRADAIEYLLKTMKTIEVKHPVSNSMHDKIIKNISVNAVKVEIFTYDNEQAFKTYYVGGETKDMIGSYMIMENSSRAFAVYIPGFNGFLAPRYNIDGAVVNVDLWRNRNIFNFKAEEIKSVSVKNNDNDKESFSIYAEKGEYFFTRNNITKRIPLKNGKQYFDLFDNVNCEGFMNNFSKKDSIFNSQPFHIITIEDINNNTTTLQSFHKKPEKEEYLQIDGKKQEYDVDRMYAKFKDDLLLIQFYVFDKILLKSAQFNVEK